MTTLTSLPDLVSLEHPNSAVLKQKAKTIQFPLTQRVKDCINTMREVIISLESPYGKPAGLAAPQIGQSLCIFFFQIPPEAKERRNDVFECIPLTVFLNPSYTPIAEEGRSKDWEGCFSVPGKIGEVYRYHAIHYTAYNEAGEEIRGIARGFFARVIQHETDHLNGIIYTELLEADCRFGNIEEIQPRKSS